MKQVSVCYLNLQSGVAAVRIFSKQTGSKTGPKTGEPVVLRRIEPFSAYPFPERFVVFDLETTGLDAEQDEIIEMAAIKVDRGLVQLTLEGQNIVPFDARCECLQTLVKPSKRVPKSATQIHGITQEMVDQEGRPLESALQDFVRFIGDLPLVAFHANFDMGFLQHAAVRHGISMQNESFCALELARRAWPGLQSYKLGNLAKLIKLPVEDAHRALGDSKRTLMIYCKAAAALQRELAK